MPTSPQASAAIGTSGTDHSGKLGVLSVQLPSMGHRVFGGLLRRAFTDSDAIDFHAYWTDEEREPYARVVNRLLRQRLPFRWVGERNADIRRARAELGYAFYARRIVERLRRRMPVDILHFHTQTAALLCADIIRQIPTVITLDQSAAQIALETPRGWRWTHTPDRRLEHAPLRAAAAVVPFSQWAARSVIAEHGLAAERVHVVPIGINLSDFAAIDRERRQTSTDRPLRILFVGLDFERKGGALLVDVFLERFAAQGVELHLVTAAPKVVSHPQIFVHRNVKAFSDEWKDLYARADVFALPTRWEAFGIVFLEAMAAGLPVVGTKISAVPEIVENGKTGLLIEKDNRRELGDALERLLTDSALRRDMGEAGRRRAALHFDGEKSAAELRRIFMLVARPRSPHR